MDPVESQTEVRYPVTLTASEVELIRTALQMLVDTLGHEEADELAETQAVLARLPHVRPSA
jgi:hypothetical protein